MADLFSSAAAGLRAAGARASIAADNIANARTTRSLDPPVDPAAAAAAYTPGRAVQTTGPTGLPVVNRVPVDPPFQPVFDPGHPDANADGLVGLANVDLVTSVVELAQAEHAYKASAAVLRVADELSGTLLDSLA